MAGAHATRKALQWQTNLLGYGPGFVQELRGDTFNARALTTHPPRLRRTFAPFVARLTFETTLPCCLLLSVHDRLAPHPVQLGRCFSIDDLQRLRASDHLRFEL